jgi:hypothetical protein
MSEGDLLPLEEFKFEEKEKYLHKGELISLGVGQIHNFSKVLCCLHSSTLQQVFIMPSLQTIMKNCFYIMQSLDKTKVIESTDRID